MTIMEAGFDIKDIKDIPTNGRHDVRRDDVVSFGRVPDQNTVPEPQNVTRHASLVDIYPRLLRPVHNVAGVEFEILRRDELLVLKHKGWSLMGRGRTLAEAEKDLVENARDDASFYLAHPVHRMTPEAISMRDFILSVI